MLRGFFKLFVVALLLVGLLAGWAVYLPVKPAQPVTLLIAPGSSTGRIAEHLEQAHVIRSAQAFLVLRYLRGGRSTLKAGEYEFSASANALDVMNRMIKGDVVTHTVVVPEGYNLFDIAQAVENAGLGKATDFIATATASTDMIQSLDPEAKSLEGYLFPDTYQFMRTQSMHDIVQTMVRRFEREARGLGLNGDVHAAVTLASIVEKETAVAEERATVASVYQNRLNKKIALDADPTVVYAALLGGHYRGTIYQSDLQADSRYNTYKYPGLPPGPIANPGRAALLAAMHPASTDYLYFVAAADGSGRHNFSASYEDHQRNVAAYRRAKR
jgi:UPF0755 protein